MPRRTAPHHGMPALGTLRRHAATGPGSAPAPPTTPAVAAGALPNITPSPCPDCDRSAYQHTDQLVPINTPPTSATEGGEANGAMDVEGEGEVASTMRKHQRGADGGVVVVASVQLGGMSPTRVGTSGVRVQHSSPDRN